MKYASVLVSLVLTLFAQSSFAQQTLLLRQPAVSAEKLAFVYAGDLWIANRDGSTPRRLTTSPADESAPSFSPDGSMLAYAARYENNLDVYVIAVDGGQPHRLTWHPGDDIPTGWTPDGGAVTFVSARETDHGRSGQLFHVSLAGGLPVKRMQARFYRGVYDETGERLAYIAFGSGYNGLFGGTAGWKGYRGGTTPSILIMDMKGQTVTTVPGAGATNFNPFWLDGKVYFLSDREGALFNVFRYDPASGLTDKISDENVWEVRAAAGFATSIVYEAGGRLKNLDLVSGQTSEIVISIDPDLPQLRPQWKDASGTIEDAGISPSGKRAIITARGEVFTVPVDKGSTRNVSGSGDAREYAAIWSPDGNQIAYIVDAGGAQSLVISEQTGMGESRRFKLGPYFYNLLEWAPGEAGRIVFQDNHLSLYSIELSRGVISKIATGSRREDFEACASPDGRWLAYTLERPNFNRSLMLLNIESGREVAITDGAADIASPVFSRDGKYLYFAASTNSGPTQVGLNMTSRERPYRAGLYAVVLAANGKSPLLPGSGDENAADAEKDRDDEEAGKDDKKPAIPDVRIDLDGLASRVVALPVAERNYASLGVADDGNLYYLQLVQAGASIEPPGQDTANDNALLRFSFDDREATSILTGVNNFSISADGKHMIIAKADKSLAVAEIAETFEPKPLKLDGLRVRVDPRKEWGLIFDEAWRMEKEYFYDPGMHGLDWQAIYDRYRPLVAHVGRREDLSALLVEMIAEMGVGHNRTGGGDTYAEQGTETGLLGANLTIENGHYRIARIYNGERWNPFIAAPLATPGNEARDGDYLLAINGRELKSNDNIFDLLQGTVGKQVTLRVGPEVNGRNAREIVVEPVDSEQMLRLWHWVEDNRRRVDAATGGRVGYVYLPNTADAGFTFFNRMFFAQVDKEAMIIDERSNAGGQAANYITDVLSRRHLSGWKDRDGLVFNTPAGAMHGPKVMMIDQDAGSGGDFLPYAFQYLGIGKLIGTRTWGGLIGISANPNLMDGGALVVPFFRFFNPAGHWAIENQGVSPDIEVVLDPIAANQGRDTQLERAIQEVKTELGNFKNPIPAEAPAYPTQLGR